MKKIIISAILCMSIIVGSSGCAKDIKPFEFTFSDYQKTPDYVLNMKPLDEQLSTAGSFDVQYAKDNGEGGLQYVDTSDDADMVILVPSEYSKVTSLTDISLAYREVIKGQVSLINLHVATINALKEQIAVKDQTIKMLAQAWSNSENAYRQERKSHRMDNLVNRLEIFAITIGGVVSYIAMM